MFNKEAAMRTAENQTNSTENKTNSLEKEEDSITISERILMDDEDKQVMHTSNCLW